MSKIEQLKELLALLGEEQQPESKHEVSGQFIAVLDRGFVYVGNCHREGDCLIIEGAKNIRVWGTEKGLGQLRNGPLSNTKLDECGTVAAPWKSVIHLMSCSGF